MKHLYDNISAESAQTITKQYSTSFSLAVKLLSSDIRQHIYNIYGFVRLADEIVDTFHDYPQEHLLNQFEADYHQAVQHGLSINPVIHAFQQTVNECNITPDLVQAFLDSMRADLHKTNYTSTEELAKYIYGSADVVGLMCLKVFVKGNEAEYQRLKAPAMRLGSAFQKVNFLRDLRNDAEVLNRSYFPNLDLHAMSQEQKSMIVSEIREDFEEAYKGIAQLPTSARKGVYVAYRYYLKLFKKLEQTEPQHILQTRIRVNNATKLFVLLDSEVRLGLNVL